MTNHVHENSLTAVPLNSTAGVEGPKRPIKLQSVSTKVLRQAVSLKTKKSVQEELNIIADILISTDTREALFLE